MKSITIRPSEYRFRGVVEECDHANKWLKAAGPVEVPVFPVSVYESPKAYIFLKGGVGALEKTREEERSMYIDAITRDKE